MLVDKVRDIVGLYFDPPDNALVLCVDEKSQIQALDRTQPLLPIRPGQAERRTHDYRRHATMTLFAALDTVTRDVIPSTSASKIAPSSSEVPRPRSRRRPAELDVLVAIAELSTHKAPSSSVARKRPRYHLHFTPTHASWLYRSSAGSDCSRSVQSCGRLPSRSDFGLLPDAGAGSTVTRSRAWSGSPP